MGKAHAFKSFVYIDEQSGIRVVCGPSFRFGAMRSGSNAPDSASLNEIPKGRTQMFHLCEERMLADAHG
jgi:hypothetical protein